MKGKVIKYFEDKGFGFIKTSDSREVFFHISDVNEVGNIMRGVDVQFTLGENNKGLCAKNIEVSLQAVRPQFISIGDERIKLSNIKHYGVHEETEEVPLYERFEEAGYQYGFLDKLSKFIDYSTKSSYTLYITTYQGDNYRYHHSEIDINETMKKLDSYLTC